MNVSCFFEKKQAAKTISWMAEKPSWPFRYYPCRPFLIAMPAGIALLCSLRRSLQKNSRDDPSS